MNNNYLKSTKQQFHYYKDLGDKTFSQLTDKDIHWKFNDESNSIAIVVKHIVGNQLSRWTNFKTEDGEKEWRHRDTEFEGEYASKKEMISAWKKGWNCLFDAINSIKEDELLDLAYIRNEGHTYIEAINRQLSHYSYHVGQIIFVAKMIKSDNWKTISIAKNKSASFNNQKFSEDKSTKYFTEDS
ncbi:MAG: DUF1572 family protein [Flavobacteriaceae bacterium]